MTEYTLTRSKRKTIAICIRDGGVEVKAPLRASQADIDKFVTSKQSWIEKNLAVSTEKKEQRESFSLNYDSTLTYRGKQYPIIARNGSRIGFDDEQKHFYLSPNLSSEQLKCNCAQIYKMLAKRNLSERVKHFARIMNVTPTEVKVNSAKTRWGSCSRHKPTAKKSNKFSALSMQQMVRNFQAAAGVTTYNLNFSWRLIMADDDVIDYVVVHELAHITEMNHSPRFWAIVEGVLPDYKERQARLKKLQEVLSVQDWEFDFDKHDSEQAEIQENSQIQKPSWHYGDFKTILSPKNGINLYRGCTHNCIYCDSRSACYQMKHDFEDIEVKRNAVQILEQQLRRKAPCMIGTGAMCDPYIHLEDELQITRQCLELIEKYGFGCAIQTKSARIIRDLDLLKAIHSKTKCVVQMTITTFNEDLCRIIEPDVSTTAERFDALMMFKEAGIPTVVWLTPILPFINDTEENLRGILDYCVRAGVRGIVTWGFGTTMREGSREYFYKQLDKHFPGLKQRYIAEFGNSYECKSPHDNQLWAIYKDVCSRAGIIYKVKDVFEYMWQFETRQEQLTLF